MNRDSGYMQKTNIYLTAVLGLDFDLKLLPHFIQHYLDLGIEPNNFLLILNCFKYPDNLQKAIDKLQEFDIKAKDIWETEYESQEKWYRTNKLLNENVTRDDWVIHPDFDEFHVYPKPLTEVIADFENHNITAVQGVLVDRVGSEGEIKDVEEDISIWEQYPLETSFSKLLLLAGIKLMLYKGDLRANNGSGQIHERYRFIVKYPYGTRSLHEYPFVKYLVGDFDDKNKVFIPGEYEEKKAEWEKLKKDFGYIVYHFKWTGMILEKLEQRVATYLTLQRPQWRQSQNFLDYYNKHGRIQV